MNVKEKLYTIVFGVWNIYGDHSRKNQVKATILVIDKYALKKKLSYFITNNFFSNDIFVAKIIDLIRSNFDIIKEYLKKAKTDYVQNWHLGFLATAINTVFILAQKYFKLISETPVYLAAFLLNPTQKWEYFNSKWQDPKRQTQAQEYREILQEIWLKQYKKHGFPTQNSLTNQSRDIIDKFLNPTISYWPYSSSIFDEFEHYCQASTSSLHSSPPVLE